MWHLMLAAASVGARMIVNPQSRYTRISAGRVFGGTGTHTYIWNCNDGTEPVSWFVGAVGDGRPALDVRVYKHVATGSPWDNLAGSYTIDETTPHTRIKVESCPHETIVDPQLALSISVFARYHTPTCLEGIHEISITSSGQYVFGVGEDNTSLFPGTATWWYNVVAWHTNLPFGPTAFVATIIFVGMIQLISVTSAEKRRDVSQMWWETEETVLVVLWLSSLTTDVSRASHIVYSGHCQPTHGIVVSTDHNQAAVVGITVLRAGIAVLYIACAVYARSSSGDWTRQWPVVVSIMLIAPAVLYGTGYGIGPVATAAWCVYRTRKPQKKSQRGNARQ